LLFLVAAFLFNTYSPNVYEAYASISPVENKTSSLLSSDQPFGGLESLQSPTNVENEINNLSSFALVYQTISDMNLEVSYWRERAKIFKKTNELYERYPFQITIDKSHVQAIDTRFHVTVLNDVSYRLTASAKEAYFYNFLDNQIVSEKNSLNIDTICRFNETIVNKAFKFSVSFNKDFQVNTSDSEYKYYFTFNHLDYLAKDYLANLKIERVSPLASILKVQFQGKNPEKTISFLNRFLNTFLEDNLDKKNKMARSTVNFIDNQISGISDSLSRSESALKN
jgi:tyrosine-protein kinase Etk/Wzc